MRVGLSSEAASDRAGGHGLMLCHLTLRLGIRRNFLIARVIRHWNALPREVVESPSMEVFKESLEVGLSAMVWLIR